MYRFQKYFLTPFLFLSICSALYWNTRFTYSDNCIPYSPSSNGTLNGVGEGTVAPSSGKYCQINRDENANAVLVYDKDDPKVTAVFRDRDRQPLPVKQAAGKDAVPGPIDATCDGNTPSPGDHNPLPQPGSQPPKTPPASKPDSSMDKSRITVPPLPGGDTAVPLPSTAINAAATSQGQDLVSFAMKAQNEIRQQAYQDYEEVSQPYRQMPLKVFDQHLERAQDSLTQVVNTLSNATQFEGVDSSESKVFTLNARKFIDLAGAARGAIAEDQEQEKTLGSQSPFKSLLGPTDNPLAKSKSLAEIFGGGVSQQNATSNDVLVQRIGMFYGLPPEQRTVVAKKLKLFERGRVVVRRGDFLEVDILHNGYYFGAGTTGVDCSSFVSSLLSPQLRQSRLTTLDLRTVWIYLRKGYFPQPPQYAADRAKLIREVAQGFKPIDLYAGDQLTVGDLLIYRLPWDAAGHVFLVRNYNGVNMQAQVIEAAQSAGTVRERSFALSLEAPNAKRRYLRPGLMALRLKPTNNAACKYKETAQLPSKKKGGKEI